MTLSILRKQLISTLFFSCFVLNSFAQGCTSNLTLNLKNIRGGTYPNQTVVFKSKTSEKEFSKITNSIGAVEFNLPCDEIFIVTISNYTHKLEMSSRSSNGSNSSRTLSYEPNMAEKDKFFDMNETQKKTLDLSIYRLPDTIDFKSSIMPKPRNISNYSRLILSINNLNKQPLKNEVVTMTGETRNKSFRGVTNSSGRVVFYLPKGDSYSVNFVYNKNYAKHEVRYSKGTANANLNLMYLGTPEMKRRHLEELERIRIEELRLKEIHKEYVAWCKEKGVTEKEGHALKIKEELDRVKKLIEEGILAEKKRNRPFCRDTVVTAVLNRNSWSEKLIVCDLTGSMTPYHGQLSAWYQLNYKLEKNLQFVFFNDGDAKSSREKIIGETGGIYYEKATTLDALITMMAKVKIAGDGGDCPENNMEALIKGTKLASPYKELVMIVDNNAPVKDIILLQNFNKPVHIILCGAQSGFIMEHYLRIAWKTKGSVHTIEQDITKIASMSEGQEITVKGNKYKIMGGEFIKISGG